MLVELQGAAGGGGKKYRFHSGKNAARHDPADLLRRFHRRIPEDPHGVPAGNRRRGGADGGPGVNPNEPGIDPTAYANAKISIIFEGLDEEEEESVATVIRLITSKGIDDQTTVSEDGRVYDNAYYNMQGVKVNMPTEKGIYVHNGKKVNIK